MKDVFIIGASISGISCASALMRHGVSTVVLEKSPGDQWSRWVNANGSPLPDASALKDSLDIRFEFQVDCVSLIDGADVLVAWSGGLPVITRRGVVTAGIQGAEVRFPQSLLLPRLFVDSEMATQGRNPQAAWTRGQDLSDLLIPSPLARAA